MSISARELLHKLATTRWPYLAEPGQKTAAFGQSLGRKDEASLNEVIEYIFEKVVANGLFLRDDDVECAKDCDTFLEKCTHVRLFNRETYTQLENLFKNYGCPVQKALQEGNYSRLTELKRAGHSLNDWKVIEEAFQAQDFTRIIWLCKNGCCLEEVISHALSRCPDKCQTLFNQLLSTGICCETTSKRDSVYFSLLTAKLNLKEKQTLIPLIKQLNIQIPASSDILFNCLEHFEYELFAVLVNEGAPTQWKKHVEKSPFPKRSLLQELLLHLVFVKSEIIFTAIRALVETGKVKVSSDDLVCAFIYAQPNIWEYLLKEFHGNLSNQDLVFILEECLSQPDEDRLHAFLSRIAVIERESLKVAIQNNRSQSVRALLTYFENIDDSLWNEALSIGNIAIIEALFQKKHPNHAPSELVRILLPSEAQNIEAICQHLFMHSHLQDFSLFLTLARQSIQDERIKNALLQAESKISQSGALVARIANPKCQLRMQQTYSFEQMKSFAENQMEFGQEFDDLLTHMLRQPEAKMLSFKSLLESWSKKRKEIAEKRKDSAAESYAEFRSGSIAPATPCSLDVKSRYSFSRPIMAERLSQQDRAKNSAIAYSLTYPPTGSPLTVVEYTHDYAFKWHHTRFDVIQELSDEMEKLHQKVMAADPKNLPEFEKEVATAYWLGANLMMTSRGNGHYMLVWLSYVYRIHGLRPLVPKLTTPMPDLLAISLCLDTFLKNFRSYFEEDVEFHG